MIEDRADIQHFQLEQRVKASANWFYLIAALSVANSVASALGSSWSFSVGLALTQFLDGLAASGPLSLRFIGHGLHLWLLAAFISLGYMARKRRGAFTIGLVVYSFDALLCLVFQAWASLVFHIFALYFIAAGRSALLKLSEGHATVPASSEVLLESPSAPLISVLPVRASDPRNVCQSCGTVLLAEGPLCVRCLSRSSG